MTVAYHKNKSTDYVRAAELRKNSSTIEQKLWSALRKLPGIKFRRQHPFHPYFADFACLKLKMIVEIDGDSHDATKGYDRRRDNYMQASGYTVLRFSNKEVVENLESVIATILREAENLCRIRTVKLPLTKKT